MEISRALMVLTIFHPNINTKPKHPNRNLIMVPIFNIVGYKIGGWVSGKRVFVVQLVSKICLTQQTKSIEIVQCNKQKINSFYSTNLYNSF